MEKRRLRTTISGLERPSSQRGGHRCLPVAEPFYSTTLISGTRGVKNGVKGRPKRHLLHRVDHVIVSRFFLACAVKCCCRHELNLFRLVEFRSSRSSPSSTSITSITNVNCLKTVSGTGFCLFRTDT